MRYFIEQTMPVRWRRFVLFEWPYAVVRSDGYFVGLAMTMREARKIVAKHEAREKQRQEYDKRIVGDIVT